MLVFQKIKIITGLLLTLFFVLSLAYLYNVTLPLNKTHYFLPAIFIFSAYIFAILSGYLIFGKWSIFLVILSVASTVFLADASNNFQYVFFSFAFISASLASQLYLKKSNAFRHSSAQKLSELKRETNQLREEFERNKELKLSLEKKLERYSELKELTETLSSSLNLKDLTHFITDEAFQIIGKSERALLFLVDDKKQTLDLTASKKMDDNLKIKSKVGDIFDRWVLEHQRPLIISDTSKDYRFPSYRSKSIRPAESVIIAPMMLEDRLIGVLRLEALERNIYAVDDLRILCVIADISCVALNNALLYARTEELAIKDGLTGLYVQRYFKDRLREEVKRATRKEYKLSLLMIDIDNFKHYNDKYGHAAGDLVLQHIAGSLHKFADTGDLIARYGGEEFAVILTEEDKEKAKKVAGNIHRHIAKDSVFLRNQKTYVTVSIGVATYPDDASKENDLIRMADANLYKAKNEGKNKVC